MKARIALILCLLVAACGMKTGDEALAVMNEGQKQTVGFMLELTAATTMSDISAVLGEPSDLGAAGLNPTWELEHDGETTQLRAYFLTNQLNKIQYISLSPMWGYTTYYDENGVRSGT